VRLIGVALFASVALALPAAGGPVTGLTTFTPGMPARASEVNGNFGIVANAVNDNLSAAETALAGKQNRVTGACGGSSAITAVAADGSVTCAPVEADGAVAVPGTAFVLSTTGPAAACRLTHTQNVSFFLGSDPSGGCYALAPLTLPHGAVLTNLSCLVQDSFVDGDIRVALYRRSLGSEALENLFETPRSGDGGAQTIFDDSIGGGAVVDNHSIIYGLMAYFEPDADEHFDDITVNLALTGCSIAYDAP
jgi:hypothetical protein